MQNQSNSKEINIKEIIKPFKEIIRKLQDEINEKESEIAQLKFKLMQNDNSNKTNQQSMNNNMGQMNMMNNRMGQMNMMNNSMEQMNNQMNNNMGQMNMMNNNMGQMNNQMNNNMGQMNMMNNSMEQMNNQMNNNIGQMNMMNNNMGQMNNQMNNNMGQMYMMNNNMGQMNNQMNNNIRQMNMMNNNMGQMNNQMNNNGNKMNMNMVNNPFNMMNNQFNMNNMMNNQMNQMINMGNQVNVMEKENLPRMGMVYKNFYEFLSIKVIIEEGGEICVQCKSNDKMNKIIGHFCLKCGIQSAEDYDFFIIKEEKVKLDSSVEQNGIKQKDYILAKKKLVNNKENQSLNDKKEKNSINESPRILGKPIDLIFYLSMGGKVSIRIGLNNTIKDTLIKFCNESGFSLSDIGKHLIFLFKGSVLEYEDNRTLEQIGFRNAYVITVVDNSNVIGA